MLLFREALSTVIKGYQKIIYFKMNISYTALTQSIFIIVLFINILFI